jgi:hypothetical protein
VHRFGGDDGERIVVVAGSESRSSEGGIAQIAIIAILALAVVVVAVLAIAIGPPTPGVEAPAPVFGGTAAPAADGDRLAQSTARNALAAVLTAYTDHATFSDVTPRELGLIEPSLSFTSGPSTGPFLVSVVTTPSAAGIAVRSELGTCFWIRSSTVMANTYGEGEPCTGEAALGASASSWS